MDQTVLEYPFWEEPSRIFKTILRPVVDVTLRPNKEPFIQYFYLDSGADITLVPLSVGEYLGFKADPERFQTIEGVGGTAIPIQIETVEVKVGPYEFKARIAWSQEEAVPLLLGRTDFFELFDITLKLAERVTLLRWRGP